MTLGRWDIYTFLYCALDEAWQQNQDEGLANYLDEANPFCCTEGSFDPAVYDGFSIAFSQWEGDLENYGYEFVLWYLKNLDPYYGNLDRFLIEMGKSKYIRLCEANEKLSAEGLRSKYNSALLPGEPR